MRGFPAEREQQILHEQPDSAGKPEVTTAWEFCQRSLVEVSRSFALIIPECPPPIDRGLCVAYLLCRIADTVEDEPGLDDATRSVLFEAFLAVVNCPEDSRAVEAFLAGWPEIQFSDPGYEKLVRGTADVMRVYRELPEAIRGPICACVHEMVAGMRTVRPVEKRDGISFICRSLAELDDYCHIVAGTVGVMSTAIFEWRFASGGLAATPAWREQGRRLGLGLQMTNIIKDCRMDAERGVSFIPPRYTRISGGKYDLAPDGRGELFDHAIAHLDAGLAYTLATPREETGIRRFLLGSLLPAIATLEVAAAGTQHHPKIDRAKMVEILELITDEGTSDAATRSWYESHRARTRQAVAH